FGLDTAATPRVRRRRVRRGEWARLGRSTREVAGPLNAEICMNTTSTLDPVARPVRITSGPVMLHGDLAIPDGARGVVLFAHGSGSSRHSPRNRFVAETLHEGGLATLLFDLLTEEEEYQERFTRHLRFDIGLLAQRLLDATDWLVRRPEADGL